MFATAKLYIDLAVALLIVGLCVFAGWQYDQRKLDAAKMDKLDTAMQAQAATLAQLQQGQQASDAAVIAMAASAALNAQHGSVVRQRVVTMGNNDATVQKWLDAALPAGGCMLDDTCAGAGNAGVPQRSASAAVR